MIERVIEPHRLIAISILLMLVAVVRGCMISPSQSHAPARSQAAEEKPSSNSPIKLNMREMGTTGDTSILRTSLTDILKRREKEGAYRTGSYEVQKTVFIRAERDLKFAEVMKVIETVKEAGASPVQISLELDYEKAEDSQPDMLRLEVTVGNRRLDPTKAITGGIELYITEFALKRSEKDSIPKEFLVADISQDGNYIIDQAPVAVSALKNELQARLRERNDKRLVLLIEKDSEISYKSVEEIARAAFEAGADKLQLLRIEA